MPIIPKSTGPQLQIESLPQTRVTTDRPDISGVFSSIARAGQEAIGNVTDLIMQEQERNDVGDMDIADNNTSAAVDEWEQNLRNAKLKNAAKVYEQQTKKERTLLREKIFKDLPPHLHERFEKERWQPIMRRYDTFGRRYVGEENRRSNSEARNIKLERHKNETRRNAATMLRNPTAARARIGEYFEDYITHPDYAGAFEKDEKTGDYLLTPANRYKFDYAYRKAKDDVWGATLDQLMAEGNYADVEAWLDEQNRQWNEIVQKRSIPKFGEKTTAEHIELDPRISQELEADFREKLKIHKKKQDNQVLRLQKLRNDQTAWEWADAQGLSKHVPIADFSSRMAARKSLDNREFHVLKLSKEHKLNFTFLRPVEIKPLLTSLKGLQDPGDKAGFLELLHDNITSTSFTSGVSKQLFDEDPVSGWAFQNIKYDDAKKVAMKMYEGKNLMKKDVIADASSALNEEIRLYATNQYNMTGNEVTAVLPMVQAYVAKDVFDNNIKLKDAKRSSYRVLVGRAFNDIVGKSLNTTKINPRIKKPLPLRHHIFGGKTINQDQFEKLMDTLSTAELRGEFAEFALGPYVPTPKGDLRLTPKQLKGYQLANVTKEELNKYKYRSWGDVNGLYQIYVSNGLAFEYTDKYKKNKHPFILNLHRILTKRAVKHYPKLRGALNPQQLEKVLTTPYIVSPEDVSQERGEKFLNKAEKKFKEKEQ